MIMENRKDIKISNVGDGPEHREYSLEEAIELTGHGCYNYLVLLACCIISNAVALDMFGFTVVVAAASCDLKMGLTETGALASAPFAGVLFAFPWGYYADTRGRRRALLLSTSVGFIVAALTSFAWRWELMLALKIAGCAFSSASFSLTMTYLGECTGPKLRNRYMFILTSMNLASEIVSFGLALILLPLDFNIPITWLSITFRPWRLFTLVMAVTLGVGALMMLLLHESPKFLADQGEREKTLQVLRRIYETNKGKKGEYTVRKLTVNEASSQEKPFWNSVLQQTVPIFKPPLLWTTLMLFYLITICCSTNNVFLMWFTTMVNLFFNSAEGFSSSSVGFCERIISNITTDADIDGDPSVCNDTISPNTLYSGMGYGLVLTLLTLAVSSLASWRRLLLITILVLAAFSGVLVDLIKNPIVNVLAFMMLQSSVLGLGGVASYFVDLYPTSYRALATSLGMMTARLVSLAGVNMVGAVIVHHCSLTFYGWSIFVLSGAVVAFFLPPDGKFTKSVNDD